MNFIDLLRDGDPDYVINAAALAYLVARRVVEAVIARLLGHEYRSLADEAVCHIRLDSFEVGTGKNRRVTEADLVSFAGR